MFDVDPQPVAASRWPSPAAALLIVLLAALPALISLLILGLMQVRWDAYVPWHVGALNDGLYYWRQIFTFSGVGFDGGYYTINELPARAAFSHYYFYGPMFPLLYGTIGRLFGWGAASMPLLNTVLVTLALGVYGYANRADTRRLRLALLLVGTFWPLLLFVATSMQEGLHMALAIVLSAGFVRLLRDGPESPVWLKAGIALLLALAGLMRISWAVLYAPYFLFAFRQRGGSWRPWAAAAVVTVALAGLFGWWSAPYPYNFPSQLLQSLQAGPGETLGLALQQVATNLLAFVVIGNPLVLALRAQIVGLLALCLYSAWRSHRDRDRFSAPPPRLLDGRREMAFHSLNLGLALLFNLAVNEFVLWRDYRNLGPHLVLSLLVLVSHRRDRLIAAIILSNALLSIVFVQQARTLWSEQFVPGRAALIGEFALATGDRVRYDATTENAWCNTVLTELIPFPRQGAFYPGLMALDPGLGVSFYVHFADVRQPLKSKWVFMSTRAYERYRAQVNLEAVATVAGGTLFRNRDADCPP